MWHRAAQRSILTRDEEEEWERLTAWFLAWQPPAEPYMKSPCCVVLDPAANHAYYVARIRESPRGEMQRGLWIHLRRYAALFGGPI